MAPTVHTRGITENALGCSSFQGHSSATVVRSMPTLPLPAPPSARANSAMGRFVEKPHSSEVHIVFMSPSNIIGLRPYLSDAAPHNMPVKACEMEKTDEEKPAQRAMSGTGTPNDSIISGT